MQAHEYHRFFSTGRVTLFVPLHNRVQLNMCRDIVRDVEKHFEITVNGQDFVEDQRRSEPVQKKPTPLFSRLRSSTQRAIRWDFILSSYHYFAHIVFRAHFPCRIRRISCYRSQHLRIGDVRNDNVRRFNRYVAN